MAPGPEVREGWRGHIPTHCSRSKTMVLKYIVIRPTPPSPNVMGVQVSNASAVSQSGGVQFPLRVSSIERLPYDSFGIREQKEGPSFRKCSNTVTQRPAIPHTGKTCTQEPPWPFAPLFLEISTRYGRDPDHNQKFIYFLRHGT